MEKSHKQELLSLLETIGKMADLLPKLADPCEQIQDIVEYCTDTRELNFINDYGKKIWSYFRGGTQ